MIPAFTTAIVAWPFVNQFAPTPVPCTVSVSVCLHHVQGLSSSTNLQHFKECRASSICPHKGIKSVGVHMGEEEEGVGVSHTCHINYSLGIAHRACDILKRLLLLGIEILILLTREAVALLSCCASHSFLILILHFTSSE